MDCCVGHFIAALAAYFDNGVVKTSFEIGVWMVLGFMQGLESPDDEKQAIAWTLSEKI